MPILNNIPRKSAAPIRFPLWNKEAANAKGQHVPNGFEGLTYNSQFTDTDTPPLATNFNTATITQLPATRQQVPGRTVPLNMFKRVTPVNVGESYNIGKPVPIVKRVNGPSSQTDTPFHPVKNIKIPPRTVPVNVSGEKLPAVQGSFFDASTAHKTLTGHVNNDPNTRRWQTVKTGAMNV